MILKKFTAFCENDSIATANNMSGEKFGSNLIFFFNKPAPKCVENKFTGRITQAENFFSTALHCCTEHCIFQNQ